MKAEILLTLSRLNCNGCVRNVTQALQALPDVEIQQTDTSTRTIQIRYPADQVSLETIKATLAEAHYPVVASCPVQNTSQV